VLRLAALYGAAGMIYSCGIPYAATDRWHLLAEWGVGDFIYLYLRYLWLVAELQDFICTNGPILRANHHFAAGPLQEKKLEAAVAGGCSTCTLAIFASYRQSPEHFD